MYKCYKINIKPTHVYKLIHSTYTVFSDQLSWHTAHHRLTFLQLKGSVKEPNKFHIYENEKITREASDAAEYIELFGSFTRDRHAWRI